MQQVATPGSFELGCGEGHGGGDQIGDLFGDILGVVGGAVGGALGAVVGAMIPPGNAAGAALGATLGASLGASGGAAVAGELSGGGGGGSAPAPAPVDPIAQITSGSYDPITNTVTLQGAGRWAGNWRWYEPPTELLRKFGLPLPGQGPVGGYYEPQLLNARSAVFDPVSENVTFILQTGDSVRIPRSKLTSAIMAKWSVPVFQPARFDRKANLAPITLQAGLSKVVPTLTPVVTSSGGVSPLALAAPAPKPSLSPAVKVVGVGALAFVGIMIWRRAHA